MSEKKANRFWIFPLLFCFCLHSQTPQQTSNPFSRYGLGEIENKGFAPLAGMGRAFTAFENDSLAPVFINASNPASLASLQLTCFEAGAKSYFNFLESPSEKSFQNNTYLSYISLGFPLGRKTGIAAGISPFSNVGYKIVDNYTTSGVGDMRTEYEGNGGLSQVFLGLGYKPFRNLYTRFRKSQVYDSLARAGKWEVIRRIRIFKTTLSSFSLGANGYFMFGDLNSSTRVIYPNSASYFNTRRIRTTRISDFYSSYGAMLSLHIDSSAMKRKCVIYDTSKAGHHIEYRNECPCRDTLSKEEYEKRFPRKFQKARKKDLKITFGATAYLPMALDANYSAIGYTYKPTFISGIDYPYDTTLNIQRSGSVSLPLMMSFGMGIKSGNSLTLLADVNIQNWSYYKFFGAADQDLRNSIRYSLGFQYINNSEIKTEKEILAKKSFFRGGVYYNTGYLEVKNTPITEYGVTLGVGIPLGKKVINHLNFSTELGTWGTTGNNLIKNNFIRCTLGLTLNDRWFLKRVID